MKRLTYLRTVPATLLSLINLIFSALYLVVLFRTVFFLGTYIGTTIRAFQYHDFTMIPKSISDLITSVGMRPYLEQITGGFHISFTFDLVHIIISTVLVVLFTILYPILAILNGTSSMSLRIRGRHSRMLQVIHTIYAIFSVLLMIFLVVITCILFISKHIRAALQAGTSGNLVILMFVFIASAIVLLFVQFLSFCYHKDVAQNMSFISSDTVGAEDYLDENHLSGLSIFFGLLALIPSVGLFYQINYDRSLPLIILLAYFILCSLKFFLVAAANHGLKKTIKARSRRSRR